MKTFYHNYEWEHRPILMPELVRSRYLHLPGSRQRQIFHCNLDYWVLDGYEIATNSFWRQEGEEEWIPHHSGMIRLIRPGTKLVERQEVCKQYSGWMIFFRNGETADLEKLFAPGQNILVLDYNREIMEDGRKIAILGARYGEEARQEAQLLLFRMLTVVGGLAVPKKHSLTQGTMEENVDSYLRHHLCRKITRQEIADALNISVSTLSHRYQQTRGISVLRRHLNMRLEQARSLLASGVTLKAAAEALAFSGETHLCQAFKSYFGVTVSEYRKRMENP